MRVTSFIGLPLAAKTKTIVDAQRAKALYSLAGSRTLRDYML